MNNIKWYDIKMTSNTSPAPYVASASSEWVTSGFSAYNAFDQDNTTRFATNTNVTTGTLTLDFGKEEKVSCIEIFNSPSNIGAGAKSFVIEGSKDNSVWKTLSIENNIATGTTKIYEFEEVDYRYYRINLLSPNNANFVCLFEVKFGRRLNTKMVIKNQQTNQHYSLTDKTLILLPDDSNETIIKYGVNSGVEVMLDEAFDKFNYINESFVKGTNGKITTQNLNKVNKILGFKEV